MSDDDSGAFDVLGLHCPGCARQLEAALAAAPGVARARVDFLKALAIVVAVDATAGPLDERALIVLAEAAGFRLAPRRRASG